MQSTYLYHNHAIRQALQHLAVSAIHVYGFKCVDKPVILIAENDVFKDGDDLFGCELVVKTGGG